MDEENAFYIDSEPNEDEDEDVIDAFARILEDFDRHPGQANELRKFCRGVKRKHLLSDLNGPGEFVALLLDRNRAGSNRPSLGRLTHAGLYKALRDKVGVLHRAESPCQCNSSRRRHYLVADVSTAVCFREPYC